MAKKRLPQEFERLAKEYGAVREVVAAVLAETTADWEEVQSTCCTLRDVGVRYEIPQASTVLKGVQERGFYGVLEPAAHPKPHHTTVARRRALDWCGAAC